jgi:23S rRNA pseudouridine2605 synthase
MNNKEGNKKSGARPTSSRPSSNKPNLRCKKRHKGQKVKINTKVAEVVTDKVEKNQIRHQKRPKVKDEIVLINTLPILALAQDVTRISTTSGNVKVNGIQLLKWDIW